MSKYPFSTMEIGSTLRIEGKRRNTIQVAIIRYCRKNPGKSFSLQKLADGSYLIIRRMDGYHDQGVIETFVFGLKTSTILYGPSDYESCSSVRLACERLAGEPTIVTVGKSLRGPGIFNDLDLS